MGASGNSVLREQAVTDRSARRRRRAFLKDRLLVERRIGSRRYLSHTRSPRVFEISSTIGPERSKWAFRLTQVNNSLLFCYSHFQNSSN